MGFLDTFKGKQYKTELETLKQEHENLKSLMTPELSDALALKQEILKLQNEQKLEEQKIEELKKDIGVKQNDICKLDKTIQEKKERYHLDG